MSESHDYDIIVAGLGAMGSAAACHLAAAGQRVLGFDRFQPPHTLGSSHGRTRIIREAYFEHPLYVPLVQRAYELWAELEAASGRQLLLQTGGLMIGPPEGVLITGARRSAELHHLQHRVLTSAELRHDFPVLQPAPGMIGVWEPRAGILFPELAIETHLLLAAASGARLCFDEPVLSWESDERGARIHTTRGSYSAKRLLLSAGPWITSLVPELSLPLKVERQVMFWFEPDSHREKFQPQNCPVHIWEYEPHRFFYGFPDVGEGIKVAAHHEGESANPDLIRREIGDNEVKAMREILARFMPSANGVLKSSAVCMYTNTPDEHFVLDFHPHHRQVLIASPCSGHGFKFSSVIGKIAALLLTDQEVGFDLSLLRIERLTS